MITLTLDLEEATLEELTSLIDAARMLGAEPDSRIFVVNGVLRIEIPSGATRTQATTTEEETESSTEADQSSHVLLGERRPDFSPLGDAVRDMVNEEAVRGLLDNLINNRNNRRF